MMKKYILIMLFTLAGLAGMAQTNEPLPSGAVQFSNQLWLNPADSTIWTGDVFEGKFVNLGSWHKVDSLLALKADADALDDYYTQSQIDAFLALKADESALDDFYTKLEVDGLLDGYVPTSRTVNGKALTGNITIQIADVPNLVTTLGDKADLSDLDGVIRSGDNNSELNNDAGYVTAATAPVTSVNSKTGAVVIDKGDLGLGNVDNTSDVNKPVSTAQQAAIDGKENTFSKGSLVAGTGVTLGGTLANRLVGSGNVTVNATPSYQTLSTAGALGSISISDGNTVNSTSLGISYAGGDFYTNTTAAGVGFRSFGTTTGASGVWPSTFGSGFYLKRNSDNNRGSIAFWTDNDNNNSVYLSVGSSSSWQSPEIIATQPWTESAIDDAINALPGGFSVANSTGSNQFSVPLSGQLRFQATGGASVSFTPASNTVVIGASGSGGGGDQTLTSTTVAPYQIGISNGNSVSAYGLSGVTLGSGDINTIQFNETYLMPYRTTSNAGGWGGSAVGAIRNIRQSTSSVSYGFDIGMAYDGGNAGKLGYRWLDGSSWSAVDHLATESYVNSFVGNGTLSLSTGAGLTGSASFTANQAGNSTFTVAAASGYAIPTTTQTSNWNTAYGWGNHASAGYAVSGTSGGQVRTNTQLDGRYAAIAHTHNANDINSGTLAIGRIPTGTTGSTVALGNDSRINQGATAYGWGDYRQFGLGISIGGNLNTISNLSFETANTAAIFRSTSGAGGGGVGTYISLPHDGSVENKRTLFLQATPSNELYVGVKSGNTADPTWAKAWTDLNFTPSNYAQLGTGSSQVRDNSQLDARYLQSVSGGSGVNVSGSTISVDNTVIRTTGNQTKAGTLGVTNIMGTSTTASSSIPTNAQSLFKASISSSTTYTLTNLTGSPRHIQVIITNTSSSAINVNFNANVPVTHNPTVPGNATAIFTFLIENGSAWGTKLVY